MPQGHFLLNPLSTLYRSLHPENISACVICSLPDYPVSSLIQTTSYLFLDTMYHSQLSIRSFTFVVDAPRLGPNTMYRVPHATPWRCTGTSIDPIPHIKLNVLTPAPMESPPTQRNWLTFEGPITGVSSMGVIEIQTTSSKV
ncbi:hypothetical protein PGT21_023064 [Puccinia graminis f. sp. tritici]|uniref:Uncharacterized protein n=1 Tax=Puccinia graminis f. sp. tritici TaxID=56615 RepID=A0A5B0MS04_PUCGR|nr:hypothetical protein PGT21_023025 [Puccinia graminis f. sp. tritici]KAA1079743.1 hypothetical protein PGT21_023035 [Puccinia graminis f. sp. tritici]KAA1079744.1 hypothetical protein PGT21_023040 [Puccinia graminis f. sp. tritici]KAA1079745.1 hypothetical protein PGT21_023048 [Puccinia graminis f. sp. tritici]KAA1079746.1 hypothetical protein PGT21_023055 [Puccinia graminis f. sp. tritici]